MTQADGPNLSQRLQAARLIASSLITGLLLMAGIALYLVHGAGQQIGGVADFPVMSTVAALSFATIGLSLFYIVPALNRGQLRVMLRDRIPAESTRLVGAWTANTTVLYGLLEGPSLLGLLAYLMEHQAFVLAVPGLGLLLMLAFFPSDARFNAWLDRQRAALEELKQREGPSA